MYIVAIAWIYVVGMMAITEPSIVAGIMTFLMYGVFPLSIILYVIGSPQRKRNRASAQKEEREVSASADGTPESPRT